MLEERLLVYIAATRASERVVFTYPASDNDGKSLRVSPFAADLRAACPQLSERSVGHPNHSRDTWPLMSSSDLAAALPLEFRGRPPLDRDDRNARATWNAIYEHARSEEQLCRRIRQSVASLDYANRATLGPTSVARLIPSPLEASVSRLEVFAACAFKHFANYGLKLEERRTAELEAVDLGKLHHAVLEDFIGRLVEQDRPLSKLDDAQIAERLQESCHRVGVRPPLAGELSTARETYQMRRTREDLGKALLSQRHVAAVGAFRPKGTEVAFGFSTPDSLPALEIDTPAGRRVLVRGYIDRVDLAELADEMLGVVVDYKRIKNKRLDLSQAYHGLSLQLLGYLLVLAQHGRSLAGRSIRPIAAFYVGLRSGYESVDHPDDYDEGKHSPLRPYRPRGLLNVGQIEALEHGYAGKSAWFSVEMKEGQIKYADRSDGVQPEDFEAALEYTRYKLGSLADGMIDGDISVSPYRWKDMSPCGWCPYRSVCRFEFGQPGLRFLESMSRAEVLAKLGAGGGGGAP